MLALFRRSQRFLLIIILGVIIFTFIIWGGISGSNFLPQRTTRVVGFIGNEEVSDDELASAVRGAIVNLRLLGYPPELLNQTQEIEREGWRRLIQATQAQKEGVAAGGEEVSDLVIRLLFGDEGRFDPRAYRRMVAELGGNMKPREFEEHIRKTLLIEKVRQMLGQCALVTDDDIRAVYDKERTLIQLGYVPFAYTNYLEGQVVTTNEIEEFFNTNQEEFRVPPQIEMTLVMQPTEEQGITISEEEARAYYEDNMSDFLVTNETAETSVTNTYEDVYQPFAEVRSNIVAELVTARADEMAYDRVEQLFFAMSGMTTRETSERRDAFAEAARELELEPVESGALTLQDPLPGVSNAIEIIRAAFGMDVGEYSDIVELPEGGYAMYIVTDKRDSYLPELDEIEEEVRTEIATRRAREAAAGAAGQLRARMGALTGSFEAVVAALGYRARVTEPLDRTSGIEDVGCPPEIVARLFAFPENALVVVPCAEGSLLACPLKIYAADKALMYAEIDTYRNDLTRELQSMLFNMWFINAAANVRVVDQLYEPETADEL